MSEILILSKLLQAVAVRDTTVPPSWDLDATLRGVEALLLRQMRRPDLFADVCRQALKGVIDPYARALLNLGVLNGTRRIDSVGTADVFAMFSACQNEIAALPDDPRTTRLAGFLRYQGRVFLARIGQYLEAAHLEDEEAAVGVREAEKSVSSFLAQLYHIWHLLSSGPTEGIGAECDELYRRLGEMRSATTGTNLEVSWGKGNGPIHMLQALLLTGLTVGRDWNECLITAQHNRDQMPPSLQPWLIVFDAAELLQHKCVSMASRAIGTLPDDASPDIRAAALLVQARIAWSEKDLGTARELYLSIEPVPNGHMIAAEAAQELAKLPSA